MSHWRGRPRLRERRAKRVPSLQSLAGRLKLRRGQPLRAPVREEGSRRMFCPTLKSVGAPDDPPSLRRDESEIQIMKLTLSTHLLKEARLCAKRVVETGAEGVRWWVSRRAAAPASGPLMWCGFAGRSDLEGPHFKEPRRRYKRPVQHSRRSRASQSTRHGAARSSLRAVDARSEHGGKPTDARRRPTTRPQNAKPRKRPTHPPKAK